MNKCVISFLLICVAYVADSLSIDSTFNRGTCMEGDDQCKNSAKCTTDGTHSFCKCFNGTSGTFCDTVDECILENEKCGSNSGAKCEYNVGLQIAECVCDENNLEYDASMKLCRGTCTEGGDQCKNSAECTTDGTHSFCKCFDGTSGTYCEKVEECGPVNEKCGANSGAKCEYNADLKAAECVCAEKHLEYDASLKLCRGTCTEGNDQCINGAKCTPEGTHFFCKCLQGTSGTFCDTIDECILENEKCGADSGAKCEYNIGLKVAECVCNEKNLDYDASLKLCRDSVTTPEALSTRFKYLTFTLGELSTRFKYFTTTPRELSSRFNYLTSTPGEVSTRFNYLTSTPGEVSTRSKSICDEDRNDCVNGAECLQLGNQRFCHCLKGTYGDKCQHMWDCDERYNLKCNYRNGEICVYNTTLEESECLCVESELYYDTEQGKCKKTCAVGNHDCENGAICKTVGNYGFCECRPGTSGHKCERVTDCDFMNCANTTGGRCEYDRHLEIAKCVCDNGLKYDEYAYECREICIPRKNDCQNGAMCEKEGNYSFCRCILGSYGHKCEIVEDCESQKVICNENSGARCGINMDFRGVGCLCENGLKYDEESLACRETCNFYKNKCENGAHCNRIGPYLFCDCPPGYFGHRCEKFKDKGESSPILFILLCITSGFLLVSTITLVTVFIKFRSRRN